jgi:selenocysteine-specific elongation factor
MIIGTAGHIDHGKTSLVKALTGVNADRLKEEQERGITLDLGYAYTPLANGEILGFVDVPGHEKLVHNMLAGATGIDYVLLIVAADDGVMPQTIEHLQILDLLGLNRGAVALTKIDMVSAERVATVEAQIDALLAKTGLAGSQVFPLSSVSGAGVAALRQHLDGIAQAFPARQSRGGFRLAVDRSFSLNGVGTVVTGTVFSGSVAVGDHLLVGPGGVEVRIRGIHAQNRPAQHGLTGQRCALNLAGVEKQQVTRGDWILSPSVHAPTNRMDVHLQLLADAPPLRHWSQIHLHLGATHVTGHVALLEAETLQPGHAILAQLVLDRAICAAHADRFILRDASAQNTLAGGLVLDIHAPARHRRTPQRLALLAAWQQTDPARRFQALLEASPNGLDLAALAVNANLTADELQHLTATTPCMIAQVRPPATAFPPAHWGVLCETALDVMAREHAEVSDSLGLNAEQLRMRTAPQVTRASFAALIEHLLESGALAKDGSWLHLPGHTITLGDPESTLWRDVEPMLAAEPFQPPRVRDIGRTLGVDEAVVRNLMRRLARMGRVYLVAHDHYYLPDAVSRLAGIVQHTAADHAKAEIYAAEFRTRIDTGRKLAIQILEFFDRVGYTRRVHDAHRIRNDLLQF